VTVASVYEKKPGEYEVQFPGLFRPRETIWLGRVAHDFAQDFANRVDELLRAARNGRPLAPVTDFWLGELPHKFRKRLAAHGLVDAHPAGTLSQLCTYCIAQADVEPGTLQKYRDARANLLDFFGDRPLHRITPGDCDAFAKWLRKDGRRPNGGELATATVEKRVEQAKLFFAAAVRKRWLNSNPFDGVRTPKRANKDRERFVPRDVALKLMEAATPEMRLVIALARFGGLRIPSEIWPLELTWINREEEHLKVMAPKTRRHAHKRWRFVPLFPEIRGPLADALDAAPDGATLLFPKQDITATALRNRLERLCLQCGVLPWPKLWQNMRSTRETELVNEGYPLHTVCTWLGNSPRVAFQNYLQVVKEHHQRAVAGECRTSPQSGDQAPKTTA
jgi:site-specific recombinase XerD